MTHVESFPYPLYNCKSNNHSLLAEFLASTNILLFSRKEKFDFLELFFAEQSEKNIVKYHQNHSNEQKQ